MLLAIKRLPQPALGFRPRFSEVRTLGDRYEFHPHPVESVWEEEPSGDRASLAGAGRFDANWGSEHRGERVWRNEIRGVLGRDIRESYTRAVGSSDLSRGH